MAAFQFGAAAPAMAAFAYGDNAASAAQGEIIFADALGIQVADTGLSNAWYPGDQGPNNGDLNVGLLGGTMISLGSGIDLPLFKNDQGQGLIDLGQIGALGSWAEA